MRLVSITNCQPGMKVARSIYKENGTLLFREGSELSQGYIDRLRELGITFLYIQDRIAGDIVVEDILPIEIRNQALDTIKRTFLGIRNEKQNPKRRMANQIDTRSFHAISKMIVKEVQSKNHVLSLLTHLQLQDEYIFTHSLNVAVYVILLAMKKGYDERKITELCMGALLHDIGLMRIPSEILHKTSELKAEEREQVKKHPSYGYELIIQEYGLSLLSAHCALQHHEKWDGSGYPLRLAGTEIHPYARMLAVVDVFDALTSYRHYRSAKLPHEGMKMIRALSNSYFDPEAVDLFRKSIALYPIGMTVKLNTGEIAVVVDHNAQLPCRPIVRVFMDPYGKKYSHFYEMDLSKHTSVQIIECDSF
jgi:HD-GYP domain-containing protein (c-di-GMP phosphodiesterase class II)